MEDENLRLSCMEDGIEDNLFVTNCKQTWRYDILLFGSLQVLLRHIRKKSEKVYASYYLSILISGCYVDLSGTIEWSVSLLIQLTGRSHEESIKSSKHPQIPVRKDFTPHFSFATQPTHIRLKNVLKSRSFCYRILRPPRFWRTYSRLSRLPLPHPM